MLDADRHALSASVYHQALGIKERELSNLTDYLTNLGTQSAFMFGFGVGMFSVDIPEGTPKYLTYLYYAFATICLGAEMYCLSNSTLCTILAPTIALNGPRGSVHAAVSGMYQERDHIWRVFAIGSMGFCANFFSWIWIMLLQYQTWEHVGIAIVCSTIFLVAAAIVIRGVRRIFSRFELKQTEVAKKQISGADFLKKQTAASALTAISKENSAANL